ncbi:MAG: S8 family serine peptidase [Acidobacteriota bacterium]
MTRIIIRLSSIAILLSAVALMGLLPVNSDTAQRKPRADLAYRSRTATHKMIVYDLSLRDQILAEGGSIIADYESFSLMKAASQAIDRVSAQSGAPAIRDDMNLILLRAGVFDTTHSEPSSARSLAAPEPADEQLYLVQMVGPVKDEWRDRLEASAKVLSYVPNNAYLVRADEEGIRAINRLKSEFIQWSGLYRPAYKIAPEIAMDSDLPITVTVQLARNDQTDASIYRIASFSSGPLLAEPVNILSYTNIRLSVAPSRLADIARMSDVVWIEPWTAPELFDERQGLIISGNLTGNALNPPGYLNWLRNKGITASPDFLVDVADSGIDAGDLDPEVLHEDFLDSGGLARVVYARLLGSLAPEDGEPNDTIGHGTLDAAIVGGYNVKTGPPYLDPGGYSYGLGIHPFVKLGVTKIFTPVYTNPDLADMVDMMYRDGARISNNSWGANGSSYNTDSQIYDSLVRDAQSSVNGNQEIAVVFASGNKGPNTLSIPGTAKNVITVGASENLRPGIDGCLIDNDGADEFNSIIGFSSGGLTDDGRVKPDIVAPGTHIQGAASQDPQYFGTGICGPRYVPVDQTLYTWSSGTSHSTPAVSGAAAIFRQFFQQATGRAPSPAMTKAFLTNSTTYMTGTGGGGSLPSQRQGWGLLNMGRALDEAPKQLIDQTQTLSSSGQTYTLTGTVADTTKPLRVTLCWTDAPGTPLGSAVVNNLDLEVTIGGVTYKGNNFTGELSTQVGDPDLLNNVESVWLSAGTSGDFTVRVVGANIAGDGVPENSDTTDQDFALVVYNGRGDGNPPGGGGPLDNPPTVSILAPVGGERLMAGNLVRILWEASDDKGIQSQRVEFSSDQGARYDVIATLASTARSFDWKIPPIPTTQGRIRVVVLDGVNLPVSSVSPANFEVVAGPPDTAPPTLQLVSPNTNSIVGGGLTFIIKWKESDNVGVIRRELSFSTDNGDTFQPIATIVAPSSGVDQQYDWPVPASLDTQKGKFRIKIFDGAENFAEVISNGKFEVWPIPIINDADFDENAGKKGQLEVFGRNFRRDDCEIYANGKKLKKLDFSERCADSGICKKVSSNDPKIHKRVKKGQFTTIVVRVKTTGQTSPEFRYKRKSPG